MPTTFSSDRLKWFTMPPAVQPFRVTPSGIARYFFLDCDRFLRYSSSSPLEQQAAGIPEREFDASPLMHEVLESGVRWEERVVGTILAGRVAIAAGTGPLNERRFTPEESFARLTAEAVGKFVYQTTLVAPAAFYTAFGLDPSVVEFGDTHPDLIQVREGEDGVHLLRVIDVKRGDSIQVGHRVQVLLYALILDAALQAAGVTSVRADLEHGAVWLGDHAEPEPFSLATLRSHVSHFLAHTLPEILRSAPHEAAWHFNYQCERCSYFDHCRAEMRTSNDLSRLTNLTARGKRHLISLGVRNLPQLTQFLATPDADDRLAQCASLAGERHYLERRLQAFRDRRPVAHDSTAALPINETVAIFVTLQREPLGRLTYMAGVLVQCKPEATVAFSTASKAAFFDAAGKPQPAVRVADRPEGVPGVREWFVRIMHDLLSEIHVYNRGRAWAEQLSVQVYTHTNRDNEQLTAWLMECLLEPDLASLAMELLLHFQGPDLLEADEHPGQAVPFPVVVLQNVLTKLLALPVETSYTLPETLQAMGSKFNYARRDYYHYPLGNGIRSEAVHAAWQLGQTDQLQKLTQEGRSYLFALRALLWDLRGQVKDQLFAWPDKFQLPARDAFTNHVLSRLAFFTRYESLIQCLALRDLRYEPSAVQTQLGLSASLIAGPDGAFDLDGETLLNLTDGSTMPAWLLVRDNDAGRRGQLGFRDYAYRNKPYGKMPPGAGLVSLAAVEEDAVGRPVRVTIKVPKDFVPPVPGERFRLHPRYMDFNSDRVIEYLRAVDQAGGGLFLALVTDPVSAARVRALPEAIEKAAKNAEPSLGLTESQVAAYREIRKRRVVAVWGPPGTGKTHCVGTIIMALARAHEAVGKPFRVLVTAFTHAAIENVLRKVIERRAVLKGDAVVAKAKAWQGENDPVDAIVAEAKLTDWLAKNPRCVVGATVYACIKAGKDNGLPGFDLVVVDEASQVRVSEAAIPASLVAPDGRLVLTGDDLQLPPIVQGEYPEAESGEPLLHRSIFESVRCRVPAGSPVVRMLLENRRMNDVLTGFAATLLYGPEYRCFDDTVAARRMTLRSPAPLAPFAAACLDPAYPLVVVVLEGVQAGASSPVEAGLVADLVVALREGLCDESSSIYESDEAFFAQGVFVVSPHRIQIRGIKQELRVRREWASAPFVDTVDKMQGQEAEAVVISYGVSDPEYALREAEFIYGVQRLNVAITRARSKTVVFLSRSLIDGLPAVLASEPAARGLAYMQDLLRETERQGAPIMFPLPAGGVAQIYRASRPPKQ